MDLHACTGCHFINWATSSCWTPIGGEPGRPRQALDNKLLNLLGSSLKTGSSLFDVSPLFTMSPTWVSCHLCVTFVWLGSYNEIGKTSQLCKVYLAPNLEVQRPNVGISSVWCGLQGEWNHSVGRDCESSRPRCQGRKVETLLAASAFRVNCFIEVWIKGPTRTALIP